jgi:lipopolysaccharide/colanic/teichoic acid biosynthesis glycosyltransferase
VYRFIDFVAAFFGLILAFPIFFIVYIIGLFDTGSPLFFQKRVGKNKKTFTLVKFRTMSVETKSVASHLASTSSITKFATFLRKTKHDELPQLSNVLLGDMSLVGPRPNLFNQEELIIARSEKSVYDVRPGITGLAQIQNIDMSTPDKLAKIDAIMIKKMSLKNYFLYIIKTLTGSGAGDAVK